MMKICSFAFPLCSLRHFPLEIIPVLVVNRHYYFLLRKHKCFIKNAKAVRMSLRVLLRCCLFFGQISDCVAYKEKSVYSVDIARNLSIYMCSAKECGTFFGGRLAKAALLSEK